MNNSIIIKQATNSHTDGMCELLSVLLSQEADFISNYELQKKGLKLILDNPEKGLLLIATDGQKVIGMINILFTISTAIGAKVATIEDMIVQKEFRGTGIGNKLIKQAIKIAETNECKRITLLTDTDNTDAHRFYKKHGFEKSAMVPFRRMIE